MAAPSDCDERVHLMSGWKAHELRVGFNIEVARGERLFVVADTQVDRAEFLQLLLGNTSREAGTLRVCGKVGLAPERPFVTSFSSVRANILFSEPDDRDWFDVVSGVVELEESLKAIGKTPDDVVIDLCPELKQKISLARTLYCKPDVILVELAFDILSEELSSRILMRIELQFPNAAVVIATSRLSLIRERDKVVILEKGSAVEYGQYAGLAY